MNEHKMRKRSHSVGQADVPISRPRPNPSHSTQSHSQPTSNGVSSYNLRPFYIGNSKLPAAVKPSSEIYKPCTSIRKPLTLLRRPYTQVRTRSRILASRIDYFNQLPCELLVFIFKFFNAKQLMCLRCVCRRFRDIIDGNKSIWANVSYYEMWPDSLSNQCLFRRGAIVHNKESLIKLALNHLYHFNLNPETEKARRNIQQHAAESALHLQNFDTSIYPKKPLTWMLIRPPWSSMKKEINNNLLKLERTEDYLNYNLRKIAILNQNNDSPSFLQLESEDILPTKEFTQSAEVQKENIVTGKRGKAATLNQNSDSRFPQLEIKDIPTKVFSHSSYLSLMQKKNAVSGRREKKMWLKQLYNCAAAGNVDASFELAHHFVEAPQENLLCMKTNEFCKSLFQHSINYRSRLQHYHTRRAKEMRSIIVDWLAEVSSSKDLSQQMVHAAVHYMDRFLISRPCDRTKLQLLGITCLLLAAKAHSDSSLHVLTIRESSWLTDQTYQYQDVVKMLGEVLGALKGDLWHPTSWNYLDILLAPFSQIDRYTTFLSHYLHELSLQFTTFGNYPPPVLACATLMLTFILQDKSSIWPDNYEALTGFEIRDLYHCTLMLYQKCLPHPPLIDDRGQPLMAIKEKYSTHDYLCVASIDILSIQAIKSRILAADDKLTCLADDPLKLADEHFSVAEDVLEMSMMSTKTSDYDGDCEDYYPDFAYEWSEDEEEEEEDDEEGEGFSLSRTFVSYCCDYAEETRQDADVQSVVNFTGEKGQSGPSRIQILEN